MNTQDGPSDRLPVIPAYIFDSRILGIPRMEAAPVLNPRPDAPRA